MYGEHTSCLDLNIRTQKRHLRAERSEVRNRPHVHCHQGEHRQAGPMASLEKQEYDPGTAARATRTQSESDREPRSGEGPGAGRGREKGRENRRT